MNDIRKIKSKFLVLWTEIIKSEGHTESWLKTS